MELATTKAMKTITMKARSTSKAWTEVSLPQWISFYALVEARAAFQKYQDGRKDKLGYCARTEATSWLSKHRPEWAAKLGNGLDSLMVAYALCIEPKAVRFEERVW